MQTPSAPKKVAVKAALIASSFLCLAAPAFAEEVTLKEIDGSFTLTGDLIEFANDTYVVDSSMGPLRIRADAFECIGNGCPSVADASADGAALVWDVSLWGKRRAFTEHVERIAELVEEKTEGDFTLKLHYGGLAPSRENLEGIAAGSFEMAQFCAGYHSEKNPSITVLELPFLGVTSLQQEVDISFAVYQHPATIADMARWNATLLMPSPQPQNNVIGTGFPPTSLGSFRDMKIRAAGGVGRAIEALGAEALVIPAPDVKEALTDGTVSAVAFAPHAHMAFGTIESGSWWTTNLNPGTANCPVVVNTTALDSLSPANRIALLSSVDAAIEHYVDNYEGVTMAAWGPALRERQVAEITINDEILDVINEEVAGPAAAAWIADNAAKGLPAQELYDLVANMIANRS